MAIPTCRPSLETSQSPVELVEAKPRILMFTTNHIYKSMLIILAGISLIVHSGCDAARVPDTVTVNSEKGSPNGDFIATSFDCEGGGAAGYAYTNVNLRRVNNELNPRDGLLGKHKTWSGFSDIKIRWIDDRNLEISYRQIEGPEYKEQNATRVPTKEGITIHYVVLP